MKSDQLETGSLKASGVMTELIRDGMINNLGEYLQHPGCDCFKHTAKEKEIKLP
jgi:hypothetical protein